MLVDCVHSKINFDALMYHLDSSTYICHIRFFSLHILLLLLLDGKKNRWLPLWLYEQLINISQKSTSDLFDKMYCIRPFHTLHNKKSFYFNWFERQHLLLIQIFQNENATLVIGKERENTSNSTSTLHEITKSRLVIRLVA